MCARAQAESLSVRLTAPLVGTRLEIALAVISALSLLVGACSSAAPSEGRGVGLEKLRHAPEGYKGQVVQTSGIVRVSGHDEADPHFVVDSADGQNPVSLLDPYQDALQALVGSSVDVTGRFDVLVGIGATIEVESISLVPASRK